MPISVYDINTLLKADTDLANIAGKTMNFFPVIGYSNEAPPFVIYNYNPAIPSVESYWNRYDGVRYCIYDNDVSRLLNLSERFIEILGEGDQIQGSVPSSNVRVLSTALVNSSLSEPIEKDGWYEMSLDFYVYSVKL